MEMEHRPESTVKTEEERHGEWSRWAKRALESCGLWSSHGKGKPFMEMATEEGKSKLVRVVEDRGVIRGLRQGKDECYQLVGRLREVWSELDVVKTHTSNPRWCQERRKQDVIFSFLMEEVCELVKYTCDVWEMNRKPERWKGGTSCKRGRLRKLSKEWLMKRRTWRKDSESEHLSDRMSVILKRINDVLQQMVIGECSYSAYMGETVGDSADMRGMDTKRADECVTKKEWDELVKHVTGPSNQAGEAGGTTPLDHERGNGSESGEQEHNQEDSGQHDQEETHEVESGAQSGGNEQGEPTGRTYCQGESRPEGVESDRRERWAQSGWVKVTAGSSPYAHEGAKRKKGRLRRRSKAQIRRGRCWKRSILSGYQGSYGTMKMGRVEAQQILMGECSYSAYMGESVESSGVMRKLETKGADERVTKEEWDEFVKGNGTESGEQEQNQEDSGLHDQVENNVQSSGEVDEVQSSGEVDEVQSSGEEQVGPASSEDEQVEPASEEGRVTASPWWHMQAIQITEEGIKTTSGDQTLTPSSKCLRKTVTLMVIPLVHQ
ncbi:hypothetical protein IGI04_042403 [Brassica rapa subsp. trilocularis]|uniref:DUF287 domain-containing protein n=1 Tax=Brassica rapa subsp. trilocularis TaxID=1813537 RepID=A0ABQ7KJG3_BRACM|nr:hypothetical protein IGI04_042403 [Brassica rapa subsp. trilocularis]